jgi:hypothetical protein
MGLLKMGVELNLAFNFWKPTCSCASSHITPHWPWPIWIKGLAMLLNPLTNHQQKCLQPTNISWSWNFENCIHPSLFAFPCLQPTNISWSWNFENCIHPSLFAFPNLLGKSCGPNIPFTIGNTYIFLGVISSTHVPPIVRTHFASDDHVIPWWN